MFEINYIKLKFTIEFAKDSNINKYKQSALRGILGKLLIEGNCINKSRNCNGCYFNEKCIANTVLKAKIKEKADFLSEDTMAPLIIQCNNEKEYFKSGDLLEFYITIFGDSIIHVPHIIYSYEMAGITLGLEKNKFKLKKVEREDSTPIYDGQMLYKENIQMSTIREYIEKRKKEINTIKGLKLIAPLRFKRDNDFSESLDEIDFINLISRRLLTLNGLVGLKVEDKIKKIDVVKFKSKNLEWCELSRYSNRQKTKMKLDGIIGTIEFGNIDGGFEDFIIAGELIHLGKSTVFGLGQYILLY